MTAVITLTVYVLATARGIQLVTADKITDGLRTWWLKRVEKKHPGVPPRDTLPGYLIVCAWCTSVYLAVGPAVSWVVAPEHLVLKSLSAVFAFSWLAVAAHKLLHLLEAKIKLYAPPQSEPAEVIDGVTPD